MVQISEITQRLLRFISGNSDETIPIEMQNFIKESSNHKSGGDYSVSRHTLKQWMLWRQEMKNESLLKSVEQNCGLNMKELGYIKLHNISQVQQINKHPSITNSCLQIPCL